MPQPRHSQAPAGTGGFMPLLVILLAMSFLLLSVVFAAGLLWSAGIRTGADVLRSLSFTGKPGSAQPAAAALAASPTASPTARPTPTSTFTPFPAQTFTRTPTATATSTAKPLPTETPAPTLTPTWGQSARARQESGKSILVDISEQHVYAYENGSPVFSFPASTGWGGSTLAGSFRILDKIPNPWSYLWGFWMPDWMGIYRTGTLENGFHALPVLTNGRQIWGDQIGTPISYGCVVLLPDDMAALYHWAEVGTPVDIVP